MESGPPPYRRWLAAEHDDDEAAADASFARLIAQLPRVEASPDFAARTTRAAWRARARRRLVVRLGRVAALVLIAGTSLVVAYESLALILAGLMRGAVLLSRAVVWLIIAVNDGVTWWSIARRAAAGLGQAIATPANVTALIVIELVAASALYTFHWLVRQERRDSQKGHV